MRVDFLQVPLLLLFLAASTTQGGIFSRCHVKKRVRCGARGVMTYYNCRKMGCCYRWSLLGPTCFRAADSGSGSVFPKPQRPIVNSKPTPPMLTTIPPTRERPSSEGVWRSTITPPTPRCHYTAPRRECGYPGIDSATCQERGCCWDEMELDLNWCFQPTDAGEQASGASRRVTPLPTPSRPGGNSFIYGNRFVTTTTTATTTSAAKTRPWIVPVISKPNYEVPSGNTGRHYTAEERKFLLQVNKEISNLNKNRSRQSATPPSIPGSAPSPPPLYGRESNRFPFINRNYWRGNHLLTRPTTTQPPTTTTTTTTTAPSSINPSSLLRLLLQQSNPGGVPLPQTGNALGRNSCCRENPNGSCCGFRDGPRLSSRGAPLPRVVGGTPAGSLRYSVAHLSKRPNRQHFCGGTLIAHRWVLTAAHCVLSYCARCHRPHIRHTLMYAMRWRQHSYAEVGDWVADGAASQLAISSLEPPAPEGSTIAYWHRFKNDLVVSLGKYQKAPYPRELGQQDYDVIRVVCHPDQCKPLNRPRSSDVALLRLSGAAVYTAFVQPALLPNPYETPLLNHNCMALGWGSTRGSGFDNVLKEVSVPTFSNEQCTHPDWRGCLVKSCMMCAGDVNTDPCDGDSGGPLFCQRSNGLYILHGIYSWGRCGSSPKKPSIYSRSSYFMDWIHGVVRS